MLRPLACAALNLSVSAVLAQTVPFAPGEKARANEAQGVARQATDCSFKAHNLPKDTIVIAAGSYGGRPIDFQLDKSGHRATQFDVAVHADKPVALLLGAYEPSIWSIGWTKDTRIVAVFASGYHRQVVAGLPRGTPLITSSYDEKGACGYHYFSSEKGLDWVNPAARSLFGTDATRVYNKAPGGLLDIAESTRPKSAYVTSPDTPPASFYDTSAPLAGTAGLNDALARGLLRPMVAADIERVRARYRTLAARTSGGRACRCRPATPAT